MSYSSLIRNFRIRKGEAASSLWEMGGTGVRISKPPPSRRRNVKQGLAHLPGESGCGRFRRGE